MSSLLTKYCQEEIPSIERTKISISPGTKHPRGPGSFLCLLSTVGDEFWVLNDAGHRTVRGWTERERVSFPPPMGDRWVYSVVDIADYFLQLIYFGVEAVEFKIGSELDFLNRTLSALRKFRRLFRLRNLDWLLPISRGLIYVASLFGTSQGGVMVEVFGANHRSMSLSVLAAERGEVIPAVLPSLATQMLLRGEITYRGIVPLPDWLQRSRFLEELNKRNLKMAVKTDGTWSSFSDGRYLPQRDSQFPPNALTVNP